MSAQTTRLNTVASNIANADTVSSSIDQNDTRNTPPPGDQVNGNSDSDEIQNTFIQLMVAQIRNQDPTKPVDSSEFLSQFASMSQVQSLEKMSALTQNNMVLLENLQYLSAASLVGQQTARTW